jgi:hypothetical protein
MAKLNFAVLCALSIVDKATNLFSIIDIIEQISFKMPEAVDPSAVVLLQNPMELVLDFSRSNANEPETTRVRVNVLGPNGNQLGRSELEMDMQNATRWRGFVKMAGLPVPSAGIFTFDVQVLGPNDKWTTVMELTLPVTILPAS